MRSTSCCGHSHEARVQYRRPVALTRASMAAKEDRFWEALLRAPPPAVSGGLAPAAATPP